jgi:hypothetical protein
MTWAYAQCAGRHVNENIYVTNFRRPMAKLKIKNQKLKNYCHSNA